MEVLGLPPKELLGVSTFNAPALNCTRRKIFFHNDLTPKIVPNSKGKIRKPGTKSLESVIKYNPARMMNVSTSTRSNLPVPNVICT